MPSRNLIDVLDEHFTDSENIYSNRIADLPTSAKIVNRGFVIPAAAKVLRDSEYNLHTVKLTGKGGNVATWITNCNDKELIIDVGDDLRDVVNLFSYLLPPELTNSQKTPSHETAPANASPVELLDAAFTKCGNKYGVRIADFTTAIRLCNGGVLVAGILKEVKGTEYELHTLKQKGVDGNIATWVTNSNGETLILETTMCLQNVVRTFSYLLPPKVSPWWQFWK